MSITVIVADDQPLMRSALRMCLSTEPDIDVLARRPTAEKRWPWRSNCGRTR